LSETIARAFLEQQPDVVARNLIGMTLICHRGGVCGGRIVEAEAYGDASDLASHSAVYPRARAHLLAAEPGSLYVYRSYGIHLCLNIVAHETGTAGAVLIRALEPTEGLELLRSRRPGIADRKLMSGPGNVTTALAIQQDDTGNDLLAGNPLALLPGDRVKVAQTTRIGITRDTERPWRFVDPDSPSLSGPRRLTRASL
jgi:DNA-3-methyladenine glycosylase